MSFKFLNKRILNSFVLFFSIGLISCSNEDDSIVTPLDKKIVIGLFANNQGNGSGAVTTVYSTNALLFDKNDYAGITSANLVVSNISTSSYLNGADVNAKITIDLVNLSNNQPIPGSSITTDNVKNSDALTSGDFLNNLPAGPFNLGIRVINPDTTKYMWTMYAASLVLQR